MADEIIRPIGHIRETDATRPVSAETRKERREANMVAKEIMRGRKKAKKSKSASPTPEQVAPASDADPGGPSTHIDLKA